MVPLHLFVITRFSIRAKDAFKSIDGPTFVRNQDPLDPERLELRFKFFEMTCLPSVLGQTTQDFTWVILVDRELQRSYRDRLWLLTRGKERTFIRQFDPRLSLAGLQWLGDLAPTNGYVTTTNLDDDDSIPRRFVSAVREHLAYLRGPTTRPPIGIIGAKSALEWDFIPSHSAPLGWKAPWHRARWVLSVGLSLYCKVPQFDLGVLGLRHTMADSYLDFSKPPVNKNALWFQRCVAAAADANGLDCRSWNPADAFFDISAHVGPVLLANHGGNDQATRLFEDKPDRVQVNGPADFADFAIDWEIARAYAAFQLGAAAGP